MKMKTYLAFILVSSIFFSCNDDDSNATNAGEINVFENCCSDLPVFGDNVDMLDQSQGEISIRKIVTANGDGYNDSFAVQNIELYTNYTLTVYNPSGVIVLEATNNSSLNYYPQVVNNNYDAVIDGTYKYKIVVENEQTFLKSGTFCLLKEFQPDDVSFSDCGDVGPDPVLTGL